jgi:hypothetical protein
VGTICLFLYFICVQPTERAQCGPSPTCADHLLVPVLSVLYMCSACRKSVQCGLQSWRVGTICLFLYCTCVQPAERAYNAGRSPGGWGQSVCSCTVSVFSLQREHNVGLVLRVLTICLYLYSVYCTWVQPAERAYHVGCSPELKDRDDIPSLLEGKK